MEWPYLFATTSWYLSAIAVPTVAVVSFIGIAHFAAIAPVFWKLGLRSEIALEQERPLE